MKSSELRLGSYREVVRVRTTRRKYKKGKASYKVKRETVRRELVSAPVCCLADVPIMHLSYLASRYGKFVIGFHRDAVVRHGFNPVFYALEDAASVQSIYRGFSLLRNISSEVIRAGAEIIQESIDEYGLANGLEEAPDADGFEILSSASDDLDNRAEQARDSFENFLALVKTFVPEEFGSIYCEREWRALSTFEFKPKDVAMVVVPRAVGKSRYFEPFTSGLSRSSLLPRNVPVVPWEDLVEH